MGNIVLWVGDVLFCLGVATAVIGALNIEAMGYSGFRKFR